MGDLLELVPGATDRFEIFSMETELVKAYEDPETKRKMFRGVASSTTKDLHGDTILLSALQDMERSAVGLTMFLNHSYDVPDDVGGTITKAIVKQKGVDDKGDPMYVLEIEGEVEEDNPEALKTWRFVQKGRRIGLSIGAMIPDGGAKRQKDGSYLIEHLNLLEVSFVGIPANPKSWVDYAASALRGLMAKATTHTISNPTLTLDGETYKIEGSIKGLQLNLGEPIPDAPVVEYGFDLDPEGKVAINRTLDGASEFIGAWDLADDEDRLVAVASVGEEVVTRATVWVETRDGDKITIGDSVEDSAVADVTAAAEPDITDGKQPCSECGKTNCEHDGDLHDAAPDPDVTDAKVRIIEVDTDDTSSSDGEQQGASSSEPADETYSAPEADTTAAAIEPEILDAETVDELMKLSINQLRQIALRATTELVEAKQALAKEKAAREQAEKAVEAIGQLVRKTHELLEKVADAPLPRKAAIKAAGREFSASVEEFYGADFARALRGK